MIAENKRRIDTYQRQATYSMWTRAAYHAKKLKQSDLFDPSAIERKSQSKESFEELQAKMNEQQAFLDSLIVSNTANTNEKGGE